LGTSAQTISEPPLIPAHRPPEKGPDVQDFVRWS
jgi:hypothetical protein